MLNGTTVLITGGTGGIGDALVRKFVSLGADVIFTYHTNETIADDLVQQLKTNGGIVSAMQMHAECFDEVKMVTKEILKKHNKIDVLINNSGINKDSTMVMMPNKAWDDVIAVNLNGTYNCCKNVLLHMMKRKRGKIINIASISGLRGIYGQTNYSASKAGIIGLTRSLSKEVAPYGIHVNCIAPGFIDTPMLDKIPDQVTEQYIQSIPVHRFGKPMEVANLAAFLASEEVDYIIGEVITIDGGLSV